MKHFLNFKPTIVYRKGSSFMLKTSLAILYAVPVVMAIFWGCNYYETSRIKEFYTEAEAQLAARTSEFKKNLDQFKTLKQDLEEEEKSYFEYQRVSTLCQTSWSTLLNRLESLTPGQVKFFRIGIRPEKIVRVSLEGEAAGLNDLTDFLRMLFKEKVFVSPNLKKHGRSEKKDNQNVTFNMEVDYAGESGDLPK